MTFLLSLMPSLLKLPNIWEGINNYHINFPLCSDWSLIATFRLEYEEDYEYEFKVLITHSSKIFALQT